MIRKVALIALALIVSYIVIYISLSYYRYKTTPQWKKDLAGSVKQDVVEGSPFSLEFQKDSNYINFDLLLADNWSDKEVQELLRYIDIPPIQDDQVGGDREKFDIGLLEMWLKRSDALMVISDRFRVDGPVDEDQRQTLVDQLTAGLYQTESFRYFSDSAANVVHSGLADQPGPIRDRIMYIYAHPRENFGDKGVSVADNIERKLKTRGTFELHGEVGG